MSFLIRRISRAKWDQKVNETKNNKKPSKKFLIFLQSIMSFNEIDVPADAITNCLKTTNNTLSVWEVNNHDQINDAILALITGAKQESLSSLHYIIFDKESLLQKGFEIEDYPGDTVVDDLKDKHKNISNLSYVKLGKIKNIILNFFNAEKIHSVTRGDLKKILKKAIADGRLSKSDLNETLIEKEKI